MTSANEGHEKRQLRFSLPPPTGHGAAGDFRRAQERYTSLFTLMIIAFHFAAYDIAFDDDDGATHDYSLFQRLTLFQVSTCRHASIS